MAIWRPRSRSRATSPNPGTLKQARRAQRTGGGHHLEGWFDGKDFMLDGQMAMRMASQEVRCGL